MYCSHCGYNIDENKVENKDPSFEKFNGEVSASTKVSYICPRCGHLVHSDLGEQDIKSLSAAAHAEIQRGRNNFAYGMGMFCIGSILMTLAWLFFFLANRSGAEFLLRHPEYYVFLILLCVASVLLVTGICFVVIGVVKKTTYEHLLDRIRTKTFYQ